MAVITTGSEPKALSGGTRMEGKHRKGRGTREFRTPSGSVSANARRSAESKGDTMPGGGFPIRNKSDLMNAKHSVGRAKNPEAARRWINKRAKELGAAPLGGAHHHHGAHAHHPPGED